jgi:hypothetical protein
MAGSGKITNQFLNGSIRLDGTVNRLLQRDIYCRDFGTVRQSECCTMQHWHTSQKFNSQLPLVGWYKVGLRQTLGMTAVLSFTI